MSRTTDLFKSVKIEVRLAFAELKKRYIQFLVLILLACGSTYLTLGRFLLSTEKEIVDAGYQATSIHGLSIPGAIICIMTIEILAIALVLPVVVGVTLGIINYFKK